MKDATPRFAARQRLRDPYDPSQTVLTPEYVLAPVRAALGGVIDLDPCTTPENPVGATRFYAPPDDGLILPWDAQTVYVNPPYGNARIPWLQRAFDESARGTRIVFLMPSATDTAPFHRMMRTATSMCFIKGRVKFGHPRENGRQLAASHPSILAGFNVDLAATCSHLGLVLPCPTEPRPLKLALEWAS